MLHGESQGQQPQPRVAALRARSVDSGEGEGRGEGGQVPPHGGQEGGGQAEGGLHLQDTQGVLQRQEGARLLGTRASVASLLPSSDLAPAQVHGLYHVIEVLAVLGGHTQGGELQHGAGAGQPERKVVFKSKNRTLET